MQHTGELFITSFHPTISLQTQYTATGVTFPEESFGVSLHLNPKAGGGRCPGAKSKRRLN